MSRILVIGATGTVGTQVVAQLIAEGCAVRALSRNPTRFPTEVETVAADLTRPDTLDAPLRDIDAVFLVWTAPAAAIQPALARITASAPRIVFLSAPLKTPHPLFQQPNPGREIGAEIERRIETSGVPWTFLRPGMFASNALAWWGPSIRAGRTVRWPYLAVPTAPIDPRDIAAVAVRALCHDGHKGAEYVLTGPESLTHFQQISTIGQVLNHPLTIEEASPEEALRERLFIPAFPPPAVKMLLDAWSAAQGVPALQTSTFQEVTGTPPRTFRQWAADHAAAFSAETPASA